MNTDKKNVKKTEASISLENAMEYSDFSKSICSSTDCTGLIPALPSSDSELEAYEEMYEFCFVNKKGDSDSQN